MCSLRSKLHLVQSVSISDYNDKVAHSILWLTLSCFSLLVPGSLLICSSTRLLQFRFAFRFAFSSCSCCLRAGASKLSLNPATLAMETFIILIALLGALTTLKSCLFLMEKVLEQEPHMVQVVWLNIAHIPKQCGVFVRDRFWPTSMFWITAP